MAGSSATVSAHYSNGPVRRIVVDCVGDSANGTIPNVTLPSFDGRLIQVSTNPGSTGPTDNWDLALNDPAGADVLLGAGANRDTTNSEVVVIATSGAHPVVARGESLTQVISNTSVNDATIQIIYYYMPL